MWWLNRLKRYGRDAVRGRRMAREIDEELQFHVEALVDELTARGASPEDARRIAARRFGRLDVVKDEARHAKGVGLIDDLRQDVRYGLRSLIRQPGFTIVAVLTLTLGIGANTAIFQLLNAVRLRGLPVERPEELITIDVNGDRSGNFRGRNPQFSLALWSELRRHQQMFSAVFAFGDTAFNIAPGGEVRYVEGLWVSGNFFRALGVRPAIGSLFNEADDRAGCEAGAVISHAFWQREFGGDTNVLRRALTLGDRPVPVIGVAEATFFGMEVGRQFDVAVPISCERTFAGAGSLSPRRDAFWLTVMGRLNRGSAAQVAQAALKVLAPSVLEATIPPNYRPEAVKSYRALRLDVMSARSGISSLRREYEEPLWLLMAGVGVVLLIACANLASLLLARASARHREFAVRLVLGASRGRVMRQVLTESLLLAGAGALAGLWFARAASGFLVSFLSTPLDPLYLNLSLDWRVLTFTAAVAGLACVLFGVAPAFRVSRIATGTQTGTRGATAGADRVALRRALVVAQVAMSLVLLVAAMLFVRSLQNLRGLDAGFKGDHVLVANTFLPSVTYPAERRSAVGELLLARLRGVPGVRSVAHATHIPISGSAWNDWVLPGDERDREWIFTFMNRVSGRYFDVMGMPLIAGRTFDGRDREGSTPVAIVNETFARTVLDGHNAIGRRFRGRGGSGESDPEWQVIGVVKDSKYRSIREAQRPIVFVAASQNATPPATIRFVIRAGVAPASLMRAVTSVFGDVDPRISVRFAVLGTMIDESLMRDRLMATLAGFFGVLAALLAVLGLYGVLSYTIARRRNEIGIRLALGADPGAVCQMVLRDGARLVALGLAAGIVPAALAARAATALLYGITPGDPGSLGAAVVLLAMAGIAAAGLPAWRASRVAPLDALREP